MKTITKAFYFPLLFLMFFSVNAYSIQIANDTFSSDDDGWSGYVSVSSGEMEVARDTTASKTYNFGLEYANSAITITFNANVPNAWETSDDFNVLINGSIEQTYHSDGGGISDSFITTTTTDASGNITVGFNPDTSADNEPAFILDISIDGTPVQIPPAMGDIPNQSTANGFAYTLDISTFVTQTNADAIVSYTLAGTLPTGLSFDTSTGIISGTPTIDGVSNLSVIATDNDGDSNSDAFSITVSTKAPPIMGDVPDQAASNGVAFSLDISNFVTLTDGDAITSYTLAGTLPAGLSFDMFTGIISGSPTVDGVSNLSIIATDVDGDSNSDSFSITVSTVVNFTCANPRVFTPVYSDSAYSKLVQIGNTSLCANDGSGNCTDPGTSQNNNINMMHNDYDDVHATADNAATTSNSSAALLDIPAGKKVLWAGLFWQGYMVGWNDAQKQTGRSIKYKHDGDTSYQSASNASMNWVYFDANRFYYQSFIDITGYVNANGPGYYWVGDIATTEGQPAGGSFGAWSLAVVYEDFSQDFKNITAFHGYQAFAGNTDINNAITYANNNGCDNTNTGVGSGVSSTLTGFLTPRSGTVNSSLIVFAGEGDTSITGDSGSITDDTGMQHALTNGLNPSNNVMNATISKDGATVTTGLPYYSPNTLGADIDTYDISGILGNLQSSTDIAFTSSGDGYMPGMYALETQLYVPNFCYDYAYKQQGIFFTEDNNGSQDPKISGNIIPNKEIETTIYIKNLVDSDISVDNMFLDIYDINTSEATYVSNSTKLHKIGAVVPTNLVDGSDVTVGNTSSGDFINNIDIGSISSSEYFYAYYSINPSSTSIDMPIKAKARYDLTIAGTTVPYTLTLGANIPICASGLNFSPASGIFNVVHNDYYNYDIGGANRYYNLPTQVTKREGNFKVLSMDESDHDVLDNNHSMTIAAVEMIDAGAFHYTDASCSEIDSSVSPRVWVIFDENVISVPFNKAALDLAILEGRTSLTNSADFYGHSVQNAAFRITYNSVDDNGSIVQLEPISGGSGTKYNVTNFPSLSGNCAQDMDNNPSSTDKISQYCSNAGVSYASAMDTAELTTCMECVYGIDTRFICSRDNFAIRPEAFMIKLDDQNQTNPASQLRVADNVSGVVTPSTVQTELAAGYQYNLEVTATNHLSNDSSPGYTRNFDSALPPDSVEYTWNPSGSPTGCNDDNNKSVSLGFVDGMVDINSSVDQVGEYLLNIRDTQWTIVDNTQPSHHAGTYFLNGADCIVNNSTTQIVNSNTLNGCNISSNHDATATALKYRDYNLQFHPYKFDMSGITPSHGQNNNTSFGANSFIYMSDMDNDEEMSFHLNGSVTARGSNDSALSNFTDNCYAQPVDLDLNKNRANLLAVDYRYRYHNTDLPANDQNGTMNNLVGTVSILASDFNQSNSGTINTNLNLNFDRNITTAFNPEELTFATYNADCNTPANCTMNADLTTITTSGIRDLNTTLKHYYGRTHASRQRYEGDSGTTNIYYEVYCFGDTNGTTCNKNLLQDGIASRRTDDIRWFINSEHNTTNHGNAGSVTQKGLLGIVTAAPVNPVANPNTVVLTYDNPATNPDSFPYKTTMENNASGWLIYNKDDPTAIRNQFSVEFEKIGGEWSGAHDTDTVTKDTNATRTNRRIMW
ncbi:Ig domain-containing protein [Candidatus Sulfurimonas baltica]|uniref:Putative Ig domain-containing protein n=1 Tax=Candidatus Sulfurimonas baltica TaxID=2740404 RepID=A0A7S7RLZ1_9BACT|nr:Ig domain-containing protein [Candidatus Sulfurimonas baltica]QOY51627.1 putative Ig domain-containing protein [Candidatus Sulfurimonas baltica]